MANPLLGQENYQDHALPIFQNHCAGCHNADKKKGDLDLSTFAALMAGGGSGEVVVAGDASASTLYKVVAHLAEPKMPPKKAKISDAEIAVIKKWIDGGLVEAKGGQARKSKGPKIDLTLASAPRGAPAGPPPLPEDLLLEPVVRTAKAEAVTALASSPWAPIVAVAGPRQVFLYHTETLQLAGVVPFPEPRIHVLKFSRNGKLLLAGGGRGAKRGIVALYDVVSGDRVAEIGDEHDIVLAADLSADQKLLALGGPGRIVKIYSVQDGELLHSIKKHTDWVTAMEFSPDGALLATGDRNGGIHLWEAPRGALHNSLSGHKSDITGLSWRSDSSLLASGSEDGQIMLWDARNGSRVKNWRAHTEVTSVEYAADGRLVSSGRDRTVRSWKGDGAKHVDFGDFPDLALRAVFTHDGSRVVGGSWTGEIRVWNAADGKRVGELTTNPPTLAARIADETQKLADAQASIAKSSSAVQGPADALAQAARKLEEAQKDEAAALAARQDLEAKAAALAQPREDLKARVEAASNLIKEIEGDPARAAEVEAARKERSEIEAETARRAAAAGEARKAALKSKKAHGAAQARTAEAQKEADVAGAALARAKRSADQAAASAAAIEKRLVELHAAQFNVKVHARRAEVLRIQAEYDGLLAAVEAARAEVVLAEGRVQEAEKGAAEGPVKVGELETAVQKAKGRPVEARVARDAAVRIQEEKEARITSLQPFAARLAEAAQAEPDNASLAQAAAKAKEALDLLARDVAEARAVVDRRAAAIEEALAGVAAAEKALGDGRAAAAQAVAKVAELKGDLEEARRKVPPEQAKADAFKPALDAARADLEALKAEYRKRAGRT